MKRIAIKLAGSEREPIDIEIEPTTTAGEVLSHLNLESHILTTAPKHYTVQRFKQPFVDTDTKDFQDTEVLHNQVHDGEILMAQTPEQMTDRFLRSRGIPTTSPDRELLDAYWRACISSRR